MTSDWLQILIIVALILVTAFFAASEIALVTVRKTRVRQMAEEGKGSARAILRLTENTSRFLATIQIGVTLASFFASAFGAVSIEKPLESFFRSLPVAFISDSAPTLGFIIVTIFIAFFTLVFGELVPKTLALQSAEKVALAVARPVEFLSKITGPLVFVLTKTSNFFVRLLGGNRKSNISSVSEEEIVSMVETGQEEGVIEKREGDIISRIFEFADRQVREIMVPRVDVTMLEASMSVAEVAREIVSSGYSRYPVHAVDSREKIEGVAYAKDILKYLAEGQRSVPVGKIIRPPYYVPESKKVGDLLAELQKSRTQLAIVIDEYGGLAGLVTLEDCLEEIVGEIQDEFDTEETRIIQEGDGVYLIDGATTLNEINETLTFNLQDDEVDTIAGLLLKRLGRVAVLGDFITEIETRQISNPDDPNSDNLITQEKKITIEVERLEGLRIRQVRLTTEILPEAEEKALSK